MTTRGNKLTQGGNLMWEASRMMLPEHKERLIRHRSELQEQPKPLLDEQQAEEMTRVISEAMEQGLLLRLTVYDSGQYVTVECFILHWDPQLRRLKVRSSEGAAWVLMRDLIHAELG